MSHKRVVKKGGKTYGPYLYESYRDKDGKVQKRYLGKQVEQKNNSVWILVVLLFFVGILLVFLNVPFTGKAIFSLDDIHADNNVLKGNMAFVLHQSEFIPASTQVIIAHGGEEYSHSLNELLNEQPIQGNFFIENKYISGIGEGFGIDNLVQFPPVSFVLGIYNETENNETPDSGHSGQRTISQTPENNAPAESGQRTISGSTVFALPTGKATLELVNEVEGQVRANETFNYNLENGQTAQIVSSEHAVDLKIENNQAVVNTDYLGDETLELSIPFDNLNIPAENGELNVAFVYEGIELFGDSKQITIEEPVEPVLPAENETIPEENLTGNLTFRETFADCDYYLDSCKLTGWESGKTYCLNASVIRTSNTTDCMTITNNSVVFDCNGFNITGPGSTVMTNKGVSLTGRTNVTIQGCNITGFGYGIYFENGSNSVILNDNVSNMRYHGVYLAVNSNNNTITNNILNNNSQSGIYLYSSSNNNITNNNLRYNNFRGVHLNGNSTNNIFRDNIANENDVGIYFFSSLSSTPNLNNTLINNTLNNNTQYGIHLYSYSDYNILINNTINNNTQDGIYLQSSVNNSLINNHVNYNLQDGISLVATSNNNLTNNTANNNLQYGIYISSSPNNTLINNTMHSNKYNFYLTTAFSFQFANTIDTSNMVNGKPIYYVQSALNNEYNSSTNAGTFYCISCDNITVKDLNLTENGHGIFFFGTNNSLIKNVTTKNNGDGISFSSSHKNNLTNNRIDNNSKGVYFISSSENNITNNNITNGETGIYLYSNLNNNNKFNYNSIYNNTGYELNVAGGSGHNFTLNYWGTTGNYCPFIDEFSGITYPDDLQPVLNASYPEGVPSICGIQVECGVTIMQSTDLEENLLGCNGSGITIGANNIILDCKNFNIIGNGTNFGVYLSSKENITIKNCNINNFSQVIYISSSPNTTLVNNTITNSNYSGISISSSPNTTLVNNTITNSNYSGISISSSPNTNLTNNKADYNTRYGIDIENSAENILMNNTANNNNYHGIFFNLSSNNNITNNNVNYNTQSGIYFLSTSNGNNLTLNNVNHNNQHGIVFNTSVENYNFFGITSPSSTHKATYGDASDSFCSLSGFTLSLTNENEFITSDYNELYYLDSSSAFYYASSSLCPVQKFKLLGPSREDITQVKVSWNGQAYSQMTETAILNIWNFTSGEWVVVGNRDYFGGINYTITNANKTDFVNSSGEVYIAVYPDNNLMGDGYTQTDYIELIASFNESVSILENRLVNNTAKNNTLYDFYNVNSSDDTFYNEFVNNTVGLSQPTRFSFNEYSGGVYIKGVENPFANPSGKSNISKYINITGPNWMKINISYADSTPLNIEESSLKIYRYNGTNWSAVSGSTVYTDKDIVYANLTNFSQFGLFGDNFGCNNGTYIYGCGEIITSSCNMTGDLDCTGTTGNAFTMNTTTTQLNGNGYRIIAPNANNALLINHTKINVSNLIIIGNSTGGKAITFGPGPTNTINRINNVTIINSTYGILANGSVNLYDVTLQPSQITNNNISSGVANPIFLNTTFNGGLGYINITNNDLSNAIGLYALYLGDVNLYGTYMVIDGNIFGYSSQNGIGLKGIWTNSVLKNSVLNVSGKAMELFCITGQPTFGYSNITNMTVKNATYGIYANESCTLMTSAIIKGNNFSGVANPIFINSKVVGFTSINIINNDLSGTTGQAALYLSDPQFSTGVIIENNTFGYSAQNGIMAGGLYTSSSIRNSVLNVSGKAIELFGSSGQPTFREATLSNITVLNGTYGIYCNQSTGNALYLTNITDNQFFNIGVSAIYLNQSAVTSSGLRLNNNTINNSFRGIVLNSIIDSNIANNSINTSDWGISFTSTSTGNNFTNNTLGTNYPTKFSFSRYSGAISFKGVDNPPLDNVYLKNVSKYLNITNSSAASVNITLYYNDFLGESNLTFYRHDGSSWSRVPNSTINTTNDYAYANITRFSVFAPMQDLTPPQVGCNNGTYNYTCGDMINSSCNFTGNVDCTNTTGNVFATGANSIVINGKGYSITAPNASNVINVNKTGVSIINLTINGNSSGGAAINLTYNSPNLLINNVTIRNATYGVYTYNLGYDTSGAKITGNNFSGVVNPVYMFTEGSVNNMNLSNNDLSNATGAYAVYIAVGMNVGGSNVTMDNNIFGYSSQNGIGLEGLYNSRITNSILNVSGRGIDIFSHLGSNAQRGITNSIINNITVLNGTFGLCANLTDTTASGTYNDISGTSILYNNFSNTANPIFVHSYKTSHVNITGNDLSEATGSYALYLSSGYLAGSGGSINVTIDKNIFGRSAQNGIAVMALANSTISNSILNVSGNGIEIFRNSDEFNAQTGLTYSNITNITFFGGEYGIFANLISAVGSVTYNKLGGTRIDNVYASNVAIPINLTAYNLDAMILTNNMFFNSTGNYSLALYSTSSGGGIVLVNNSVNSSGGGFFLSRVTNSNIANNSINTSDWGLSFSSTSTGNNFTNNTLGTNYPTKFSFNQYSGGFNIAGINNPIVDSGGIKNISKYLNITNSSAGSIIINISYNDSDFGSLNESSLKIYRYSGGWGAVSGSGVDDVNNIAYANLTNFSQFAIMGEYPFIPGCNNGTYNYTCGDWINSSCNLTGNLDCTGTTGNVFVTGANSIVINGKGYSITAPNASNVFFSDGKIGWTLKNLSISSSNISSNFVYLNGTSTSITLSNLILSGFNYGVYHNDSFSIASSNVLNSSFSNMVNPIFVIASLGGGGGMHYMNVSWNNFTNISGEYAAYLSGGGSGSSYMSVKNNIFKDVKNAMYISNFYRSCVIANNTFNVSNTSITSFTSATDTALPTYIRDNDFINGTSGFRHSNSDVVGGYHIVYNRFNNIPEPVYIYSPLTSGISYLNISWNNFTNSYGPYALYLNGSTFGSSNISVKDNIFENCTNGTFLMGFYRSCIIANNKFNVSNNAIISGYQVADPALPSYIQGNNITHATRGFVHYDTARAVGYIIRNNTFANLLEPIFVNSSSVAYMNISNNDLLNATGNYAIFLNSVGSATGVNIENNTLGHSSNNGIYANYLTGSSIKNMTFNVSGIGITAVRLTSSNILNNTFLNGSQGIYFSDSDNNNLINNTFRNSTIWDFNSSSDSTGNNITNMTVGSIYPTSLTFVYSGGISLKGLENPSSFNRATINKYANISNVSSTSGINLSIKYEHSDVPSFSNESTLKVYKYNSTSSVWQTVSGSTVDTGSNIVYANISSFSQFGVFADIFGCDNGTYVYQCGESINSSCNVTSNLNTTATCFTIGANNIIVDCKNYNLLGNGSTGTYGFSLSSKNNVTIQNCTIKNFSIGVYLTGSSNNTLRNVSSINNTQHGFHITSSSRNNTLVGIIADNNTQYGIYLDSNANNNTLTNNIIINNQKDGIRLYNTVSYNNITYNTIRNNAQYGINLLTSADNNLITNNNISNSTQYGIYLSASSFNNITNNNASNNAMDGIRLVSSSESNNLTNNIAINNTQYGIYISTLYNRLINNTAANNGYNSAGIFISSSYNSLILNNVSNNKGDGIRLQTSIGNNITNNTLINNNQSGVYFAGVSTNTNNTLLNNTINLNNKSGIYFEQAASANNTFILNTILNNSPYGIQLSNAQNNTFTNNNISSSQQQTGIYLSSTAIGNIFYNDTLISSYSTRFSFSQYNGALNITGVESPFVDSGGLKNISKYINVTNQSSNAWVLLNISYQSSDLPLGFSNESSLKIYRYSGGWSAVSGSTVDTTNKILYGNLTSFSQFGVFGDVYGCNNGTYVYLCGETILTSCNMTGDLSTTGTCFTIGANSIIVDGKGYYIKGNKTGSGINLTGNSNVLIQNFRIYNFTQGLYLFSSSYNNLTNNTIFNNTNYGIFINASSYNRIQNNSLTNNTKGIAIYAGEIAPISYHNITGNTIENNTQQGIYLEREDNVLIENNSVYNSTNGIYFNSSFNNTILNNRLYNNSKNGTFFQNSSYNNLINNNVYGNAMGININSSNYNVLMNNTLTRNTAKGINLDYSLNNNITLNTLNNNSARGIVLSYSNNSHITFNTAYNQTAYGILIQPYSSNNTIVNNNATFNRDYGIYLGDGSTWNNVANNTLSNHNRVASSSGLCLVSNAHNNSLYNNIMVNNSYGIFISLSIGNNLTNNLVSNSSYGIRLFTTGNNHFVNNTLYNSSVWDFYSPSDSTGNNINNLTIGSLYPTSLTFVYSNGILLRGVESLDTTFYKKVAIGKYANISNISSTSAINLSIKYEDLDVPPSIPDESSLMLYRYNGTGWNVISASTVDNSSNIVYANITSFSNFAIFGNGTNNIPTQIKPILNSTYGTNLTIENLTCWANATDNDGENITYNGYWYKNGVQNISFNTSEYYSSGTLVNVSTLLSGNTSVGDVWACNVTPYDSYDYGATNQSNDLTILDKTASICSLTFNLPSPQNYPTLINASCSCTNPEEVATLYRGGINVTAAENNQLVSLAALTYNYTCNVSETSTYYSGSNSSLFIINKSDSSSYLRLALNGTEGNIITTYGTASNITGWATLSNIPDLIFNLSRNGISVASGNPANQTVILSVGEYNYVYNTTGGANYTNGTTPIRLLNITKASTYVNLSLNNFENNLSLTYPAQVTAIYSTNMLEATMYRETLNVSDENNTAKTLAAGYYNYTVINLGNENYTGSSKTFFVNISKNTTQISLVAYPAWNNSYPIQTKVNCSANNPVVNVTLYRNGVFVNDSIGGIASENITLNVGTYNYTCNTSGNENYSSATDSKILNITAFCGNSIVEAGEECDSTNLSGQDCISKGFTSGTLACTGSCTFDTSGCSSDGGGGGEEECVPDCDGKDCGSDGCSGSCGTCSNGYECENSQCVLTCIEDWQCSLWSACFGGIQTRTCNDAENCGTELNKPELTQTCTCSENWTCSWTECAEGDDYSYAYDCDDSNDCGTEFSLPDKKECAELTPEEIEEIAAETEGEGCNPRWSCGQWESCITSYNIRNVLEESIPQGIQKRECIDIAECIESKTEKKGCAASVPIDAKRIQWCEENYVEIFEKSDNKLVSRVKEEKIESSQLNKLDISFITADFTGYCDYCYDGVKDYDEERTDCGGPSCPKCIDAVSFFNWLYWVSLLLWTGLLVFALAGILMNKKIILFYVKDFTRQKPLMYGKGVEETVAGQKSPYRMISLLPKFRESEIKFVKLIKRIISREPYPGKPITERKINLTKPEINKKSYSVKEVKSYKDQKEFEKRASLFKRIKNIFGKPKPSPPIKKIQIESPESKIARESINKTKKELGGKGF